MNLYDTRVVTCTNCKKVVGEVEFDALIIRPSCGQCANPISDGDSIICVSSKNQNKPLKIPQVT
ncbi:MAG TPA: hypothetical protein VMW55_08705 [Nitrosopumilaceae archaeon]|nr:hypothetical protein [Nitrosopumilaceae archaeon]